MTILKKTFIVSSIMLAVVLVLWGVYAIAFRKSNDQAASTPSISQTQKDGTALTNIEKKKKMYALTDSGVIGPVYIKDSDRVRYYAEDGTVWEADAIGNGKKEIESTKLPNLANVMWSPDKSKVISQFSQDGANRFFLYDYSTKNAVQLKSGIDLVSWDGLGAKIAYKYFDKSKRQRSLNIADPNGSNWSKLVDIQMQKISMAAVPKAALMSYWNYPAASEESKLDVIGTTGGDVKTILSGKFGADYLWSPNGKYALVSSLQSQQETSYTTLGTVSIDGEYRDLHIPTFVSKCAWSPDGNTIYYALPGGIPDGAKLPDDYMAKKFYTQDTFWKMDIQSGEKQRIIELADIGQEIDASTLFLSSTESGLYFINRADKKLYRIDL